MMGQRHFVLSVIILFIAMLPYSSNINAKEESLDELEQLYQRISDLKKQDRFLDILPLVERARNMLEIKDGSMNDVEPLNQQISDLKKQGRFRDAYPLARRVLNILDGERRLNDSYADIPPNIFFDEKEEPTPGKASILGSPFAGTPIWFDDLRVEKLTK